MYVFIFHYFTSAFLLLLLPASLIAACTAVVLPFLLSGLYLLVYDWMGKSGVFVYVLLACVI